MRFVWKLTGLKSKKNLFKFQTINSMVSSLIKCPSSLMHFLILFCYGSMHWRKDSFWCPYVSSLRPAWYHSNLQNGSHSLFPWSREEIYVELDHLNREDVLVLLHSYQPGTARFSEYLVSKCSQMSQVTWVQSQVQSYYRLNNGNWFLLA